MKTSAVGMYSAHKMKQRKSPDSSEDNPLIYNNNNCKTPIVPISLARSSSEVQQTESFG